MTKEEKLEKYLNDWVIVHTLEYGHKKIEVGKLSGIGENGISLDTFSGSFERGCLVGLLTLPYDSRQSSIYRIYNKECEIVYENPSKKIGYASNVSKIKPIAKSRQNPNTK